jgi:ABC-type Fe3+ transport system substrate-binding protein
MTEIFAAFAAKYPGIQITETQINPNDAPQKLLTEKAAGQAPPDLFQGQFQFNGPLGGLIDTDPGWTQYGVPESAVRPDGGVMTLFSPYVLAFNTQQIQKADLPTSWDGLADAKYAGKLSVDPRAFPFSLLAPKLGDDVVLALVQKLKDQVNPKIVQGSTAGLTGLTAGEFALRPALLEDVKVQQAKGAPIDFVVLDPAPVQITAWYLPVGAAHPNAAKLYASWFATAGMDRTYQQGFKRNSPPDGIPAETFFAPSTTEDFAKISAVTPKISAIWGNPS